MKIPPVKTIGLPLILGAMLLGLPSLHADELYWIPSSGNWDVATEDWTSDPGALIGDTSWTAGDTNADIAVFRNPTNTASVITDLSAGGLRFLNGNTSIAGNGILRTLKLTGSSPEVYVAAGATASLGAHLQILSGQNIFTKTGDGVLEIHYAQVNTIVDEKSVTQYYFGTLQQAIGSALNIDGGTLRVNANGLSNTQTHITIASGATLELNNSLNIGGISGNGLITTGGSSARTLQIRGVNGNFSGVLSGNLNVDKLNGTGVQTLSGTLDNTYQGTTFVRSGELVLAKINGAKAIAASSGIFLNGGALGAKLTLGGSGQIADTVNLTFQGGANATNIFSLDGFSASVGTLSINVNGTNTIDFGENQNSQILTFAGLVVGVDVHLSVINFDLAMDEFRFLSDPTAGLGAITINGLPAMATQSGEYWNVTAIPEPAPLVLITLAGAGLLGVRSLRKSSL